MVRPNTIQRLAGLVKVFLSVGDVQLNALRGVFAYHKYAKLQAATPSESAPPASRPLLEEPNDLVLIQARDMVNRLCRLLM